MNIFVYFPTVNYSADIGNDTCEGISHSEGLGYVYGGAPFKSVAKKEFFGTCGELDNVSKIQLIKPMLGTWQFYANWTLYSLVLLGIIFSGKKYAHYRH